MFPPDVSSTESTVMFRLALHWQILIGMILGAVIGITLNIGAGERRVELPESALPSQVLAFRAHDTISRIEIEVTRQTADEVPRTQTWIVNLTGQKSDESGPGREVLTSTAQLAAKDKVAFELFQAYGRSTARWVGDISQRLGKLFLRLLQMVAVPLIVTSLVTGVTGLEKVGRLGRMFSRTLFYYLSTSMLAIITGILMVRILRPGLRGGVNVAANEPLEVAGSLGEVLFQQVETLIPTNLVGALAEPSFLSIISFTLLFAIFTMIVGGKTLEVIRPIFAAGFEVMMALTTAIIKLAPLGVMLLMLYVTATQGADVFQSLAWYMVTVFIALTIHAAITLPLILWFVAGVNPWAYAKAVSPALLTAFSSASSNGTLPITMACVEERAGIPNRVTSFVLPLGATINMDGTALYEAVAVLFLAELYYGIDVSFTQQILVAVTALLASVGAAGIPHAGLVMMIIILKTVGLPVEMQGIILAVDRVLDMCRTSVNVWSDSCGCAVVNRFETGPP
jgi:proton glutamate symport protein